MSCADVRDMGVELALGIVTGPERAEALAHLEDCAGCRAVVGGLVDAADALVLAAPEVEPPAGFEDRVLERLGELGRGGRRRFRETRYLVAAAAVAALVGITGIAVAATRDGGGAGTATKHLGRSIAAAHTATMIGAGGKNAGDAYTARSGDGSWVLLSVDYRLPNGKYGVEVVDAGGRSHRLGSFAVRGGSGAWAGTIHGVTKVAEIRMTDAAGAPVCAAQFGRTA